MQFCSNRRICQTVLANASLSVFELLRLIGVQRIFCVTYRELLTLKLRDNSYTIPTSQQRLGNHHTHQRHTQHLIISQHLRIGRTLGKTVPNNKTEKTHTHSIKETLEISCVVMSSARQQFQSRVWVSQFCRSPLMPPENQLFKTRELGEGFPNRRARLLTGHRGTVFKKLTNLFFNRIARRYIDTEEYVLFFSVSAKPVEFQNFCEKYQQL